MDADCFREIQRQPPLVRDVIDDAARGNAYPFRKGVDPNSPFVTLLALADHLQVAPLKLNRFFEAKAAGKLVRLELEKARTIAFEPFWTARIASFVSPTAAAIVAVLVLLDDWRVIYRPYGWWSILIYLAPQVAALGLALALVPINDKERQSAHAADLLHSDLGVILLGFVLPPAAFAVALAPLVSMSLPLYLVAALIAPLFYWLPVADWFGRGRSYFLFRPNPYVDAYNDPSSRHWLRPG